VLHRPVELAPFIGHPVCDSILRSWYTSGIDYVHLGRISGLFGVANLILAVHGKYFEIREDMFSMETAA